MAIEINRIVSTKTLQEHFRYADFLNMAQEQACQKVFEGTNDVYLNLPPGNGKSLCFQLPTILKSHTLSVVFVPTDILAKSHISFLKQHGININYLCTRSAKKKLKTMKHSFKSKDAKKIQFLYILVHKQTVDLIKDWMVELNAENALSYIVFDEAHCVSLLSHDHMRAYRNAAEMVRNTCPNVCKIALTTTATSEVRRDIIRKLGMKNVAMYYHFRQRRSTYHDVHFIDNILEPWNHLMKFINKVLNEPSHSLSQGPQMCGIIFCRKREVVEDIASHLILENIVAAAYHGALSLNDRDSILEKWVIGKICVMVATHTFGIGLRKPNTRFVVHWDLPLSFQQMYQESERVSPDGGINYCRVYYSYNEEDNITTYLKSLSTQSIDLVAQKLKFFKELVNYCLEVKCRHVSRYKYFQRIFPECGKFCDACSDVKELRKRVSACLKYRASKKNITVDRSVLARVEASILSVTNERYWKAYYADDDESSSSRRSLQDRSVEKLIHELIYNYNKNRQKLEKNVSNSDILEIACRLDLSLYNGAAGNRSKYRHNVVLAVCNIRRATQSGLPSIYFEAQEKDVFDPEAVKHCIITID